MLFGLGLICCGICLGLVWRLTLLVGFGFCCWVVGIVFGLVGGMVGVCWFVCLDLVWGALFVGVGLAGWVCWLLT